MPAFAVVGCPLLLRGEYVAPEVDPAAVESPVMNVCLVTAGLRNNIELLVFEP
jgi:hypothetical protein